MANVNMANRQVCDVDIRLLSTMTPFLYFDTANVTTLGLDSENVSAKKKGMKAIAFYDGIEGSLTIEAQITQYKIFSLFTNNVIESEATYAVRRRIVAEDSGLLRIVSAEVILDENGESITDEDGYTIIDENRTYPMTSGTIFVYAEGESGENYIDGVFDVGIFTATNPSDIVVGSVYDVYYLVSKTEVIRKISFRNDILPPDYFITMSTLDKNEYGDLVPFIITAYKAHIQRTIELTFSSDGEPRSMTITFNLLRSSKEDGEKVIDFIEDSSDLE